MNRHNRADVFMSMAYLVSMQSTDVSTHVGAVIVGTDNEVRSTGYNGFPRGVNDDVVERQEKPLKYSWMEHAERNAIYNAARMGLSVKGCTMFTNGFPCADCARAIIQSGIAVVVTDRVWDDHNPVRWAESLRISQDMFVEAGIKHRVWGGDVLEIIPWRNTAVGRGE